MFQGVNWLAVLVGTVAAFLLGWAVYSPMLFGKGWAAGSRVEMGSASSMPVFAMGTQLMALFILALVIGMTAATNALWVAIFAILAAALFAVSGGAFLKKSTYALMVDGGYILASGIVMIAAQGFL